MWRLLLLKGLAVGAVCACSSFVRSLCTPLCVHTPHLARLVSSLLCVVHSCGHSIRPAASRRGACGYACCCSKFFCSGSPDLAESSCHNIVCTHLPAVLQTVTCCYTNGEYAFLLCPHARQVVLPNCCMIVECVCVCMYVSVLHACCTTPIVAGRD